MCYIVCQSNLACGVKTIFYIFHAGSCYTLKEEINMEQNAVYGLNTVSKQQGSTNVEQVYEQI